MIVFKIVTMIAIAIIQLIVLIGEEGLQPKKLSNQIKIGTFLFILTLLATR